MSQLQHAPKTPPSTSSLSHNGSKSHLLHHQSSNADGGENNIDLSSNHHHRFPTTNSPYLDNTSFSPSKARAQARQTQQLNEVKRWLTSLRTPMASGGNPSDNDRANVTMQNMISRWEGEYLNLTTMNAELAREVMGALQGVMFANRVADERRRLLGEARREEMQRFLAMDEGRDMRMSNHRVKELSEGIVEHLKDSALQSLDSITEMAVSLGVIPQGNDSVASSSLAGELGTALTQRTVDLQVLKNHIAALEVVSSELVKNIDRTREQLLAAEHVKADSHAKTEVMQAQTAQWVRETKQINLKLQEYKERISILDRNRPDGMIRIDDVVTKQEEVRKRREAVRKLEEELKSFHNLPPDLETSRREIQRARMELDQWKSKREELFSQMTGG